MDGAISEFVKVLTGLGLPGVIIAALLYFANKQNKRIEDLTDKVILMSSEQAKASEAMASGMTALKDALRAGKAAE